MMRAKLDSRFVGGWMPLWFRAIVAGLFASLLMAYALLRGETESAAFGGRSSDALFSAAEPMLRMEASAPRTKLPSRGAYRVNGMLVRFNTFASNDPKGQMAAFESAFRKLGYRTRRRIIQGEETLLGLHPKTKVMVSVSVTEIRPGVSGLRLSQRNLGELRRDFKAELAGIPDVSDAHARMLVGPVDGVGPDTLSYTTDSSREWVEDFYAREMAERGWQRLVPPVELRSDKFATLFFSKSDEECSIIIVSRPSGPGNAVLLTRGPAAGRS